MESAQDISVQLKQKITQAALPKDVEEKLLNLVQAIPDGVERERLIFYINFVISLPFNRSSQDVLDIRRVQSIFDKNHFGLKEVKDRILEYLSVLILKSRQGEDIMRAPILLFVGLVGTGKTSLGYSIAESLGRPIVRIPLGGLGDMTQLRGESRLSLGAQPGQIIKALKTTGIKNPVILLDEIDRVAPDHAIEVMGVLVELLDPEQNHAFLDYYLDSPFDLSRVLFIATANNTQNIATAVMDRLEPIQMPSYTDEEKLMIGKNYLLPKAIEETGLDEQIIIDEGIWPKILRPLGYDAGIRSLNRTLQGIIRKIARSVVEGKSGPFKITGENLGEYLSD